MECVWYFHVVCNSEMGTNSYTQCMCTYNTFNYYLTLVYKNNQKLRFGIPIYINRPLNACAPSPIFEVFCAFFPSIYLILSQYPSFEWSISSVWTGSTNAFQDDLTVSVISVYVYVWNLGNTKITRNEILGHLAVVFWQSSSVTVRFWWCKV